MPHKKLLLLQVYKPITKKNRHNTNIGGLELSKHKIRKCPFHCKNNLNYNLFARFVQTRKFDYQKRKWNPNLVLITKQLMSSCVMNDL